MRADDLRRKLSGYVAYLQLMYSLNPGERGIHNPTVNARIRDLWNLLKSSNATDLEQKGPELIRSFEPEIRAYKSFAPPKILLDAIADDFNTLCREDKELYLYGIEYRWLDERMDCSRMGLPPDLPWHARVGLAHHAGYQSIEEEFLLRDAFFMLESAEEAFVDMHA